VEHLRFHLPIGEASAALDQSIGEGGLAVVDVGDDRKIADLIHAHGGGRARSTGGGATAARRCAAIPIKSSVAARRRRSAGAKKKARRRDDAPSNKTYGNCLLGLHCIQKPPSKSLAGP